MKPPPLRLTVRRLMVAAAVAALIMGAVGIRSRWMYFHKRAVEAGQGSALIRSGAWGYRLVIDESGEERRVIDSPDVLLWKDYYDDLRRKYERAASRPWISVPPDPPPPTDWVPTPSTK